MKNFTDEHWQVYHLKHKDHGNKKYSTVAKIMNVNEEYVMQLWKEMEEEYPELFIGTSGREGKVVQYGSWCDDIVRRKF